MPSLLVVAVLLAFVFALMLVPRLRDQGFRGRGWLLFRALFPSWRFFEERGRVPRVSVRILNQGKADGDWVDCLPPREGTPWFLFHNPQGNLRMAGNSLIEQLVTDLSELEDGPEASAKIESSVSYELVSRWVRGQIPRLRPEQEFQFRLLASTPGARENEGEEIFVSGNLHE